MRLSPPLAITGIIAASFAWMAGQYDGLHIKRPNKVVIYYTDTEAGEIRQAGWYCMDGTRAVPLPDGSDVLHCPAK